jgi:hypothetical protein
MRYRTQSIPGKARSQHSIAGRWYVLALMCLVYAISIADRYVVTTVMEPMRLDLHLSDSGVAFLTGPPLALFYVTLGIPISWLADTTNRRNILACALIAWSGMTALCGLSRSYGAFMLARLGVGIGEAGGTPPANCIIADYFPAARRPMAMAIFALGAPIGAFVGRHGRPRGRAIWLARRLSGPRRARPYPGAGRSGHRQRAGARAARCRTRRQGQFCAIHAVSLAAESRAACDHGRRRGGFVGLGADVVYAHVSAAKLPSECR